MVLFLTRTYYPDGTNGRLESEGKFFCYTIELPWKRNLVGLSCIPEGRYVIQKRYSRRFQWHLQLLDVPQRHCILFHPANHALLELRGCIAPVLQLSGAGMGLASRKAFASLLQVVFPKLEQGEAVVLIVQS